MRSIHGGTESIQVPPKDPFQRSWGCLPFLLEELPDPVGQIKRLFLGAAALQAFEPGGSDRAPCLDVDFPKGVQFLSINTIVRPHCPVSSLGGEVVPLQGFFCLFRANP